MSAADTPSREELLEERIALWFMRELNDALRQKFFSVIGRPCPSYLAGQQKELRQIISELRLAAKPADDGVREVILRWWEGFRPNSFTVEDHIGNPTINLNRQGEKELARLAADFATKGRTP